MDDHKSLCVPFRKVQTTNSTSTGFTAQNSTTTEPTGTGVIDLWDSGLGWGGEPYVPSWIQIVPFGTDGDNDTFDFRVYGYSVLPAAAPVYIPQLLLDVSVVLCARTATDIAADTFFADTLTVNDAAADLDGAFEHSPWVSVLSPAEDMVSSILLHTRGCRYLKFDWDLAGAQEAVSMNALIRPFEP